MESEHEAKRSFSAALEVVERIRKEVVTDRTQSEIAEKALNDDLVEAALTAAWKFQFEDDRAGLRRELKSVVEDAVETQILDGDSR